MDSNGIYIGVPKSNWYKLPHDVKWFIISFFTNEVETLFTSIKWTPKYATDGRLLSATPEFLVGDPRNLHYDSFGPQWSLVVNEMPHAVWAGWHTKKAPYEVYEQEPAFQPDGFFRNDRYKTMRYLLKYAERTVTMMLSSKDLHSSKEKLTEFMHLLAFFNAVRLECILNGLVRLITLESTSDGKYKDQAFLMNLSKIPEAMTLDLNFSSKRKRGRETTKLTPM
jgi:hypothetical protein